MSMSLRMFSLSTVAAAGALLATSMSAGAADMVGGSYKSSRQHAVQTAYANEECELLNVTQSGSARTVRICHPVFDVKPAPTKGSSTGDAGDGSSFTVTQQ